MTHYRQRVTHGLLLRMRPEFTPLPAAGARPRSLWFQRGAREKPKLKTKTSKLNTSLAPPCALLPCSV